MTDAMYIFIIVCELLFLLVWVRWFRKELDR